jgi:tRNA nucleotidyltransferase (CCA-adding enzyme)
VQSKVEEYVRSLGLDAYLVGGAVRDELLGRDPTDTDFLVPGVDQAQLRSALAAHGHVRDLTVAGRPVGVRFFPRDSAIRELVPHGIDFAPPRRERSTGPGRHDFEIVVDPTASVEDDLERRDFTVTAIARRLETGELVDPFGGRADLEQGVLRTVSPRSFAEDPLRLLRGLRFVSQLDLQPDDETLREMREDAPGIAHVSGERIGGGLAADGLGELSKLLLGAHPLKALRLARDTGVLTALLPEFLPAIGYEQDSARQHLSLDEHVLLAVQNAADAGAPLAVRLAALFHDLGKPEADKTGADHAALGAELAAAALRRLRYPTRLRRYVERLVRAHAFPLDAVDARFARRLLREHGEELAFDLVAHKRADLGAKQVPEREHAAAVQLAELLREERSQPHRLGDLAVGGDDLLEVGVPRGPAVGAALERLLDDVVENPELNRRDLLLARAKELA